MTKNEELNTALYKKMYAEQEAFREQLLNESPEEILRAAYEYSAREDILLSLEYNDLTNKQCRALLASDTPLADVFARYEHTETGYMEDVFNILETQANIMVQEIAKKQRGEER